MADRTDSGRFAPGHAPSNRGRGGRPRRPVEERYLRAISVNTSAEDWRLIVDRAVKDAKDGDDKARRWLSEYLIGKPTEYVATDITSNGETVGAADLVAELTTIFDSARARQGADAGGEGALPVEPEGPSEPAPAGG